MSEMKLVFEENFNTDVLNGCWEESSYAEYFSPLITNIRKPVTDESGNKVKGSALIGENISVKNSNLILSATKGDNDYFKGAELRSKEFYNYGYFEIKAKVNSSKGVCPAFWLLGSRDSNSKIEYEIDIFECFGLMPDIIKETLLAHYYPNGSQNPKEFTRHEFIYNRVSSDPIPNNPNIYFSDNGKKTLYKGNWINEYHTFALDWKPDSITWLIDNEVMLKVTPSETLEGKYIYNEPMRIILTCYSGQDVANLTSFPDETTDWENGSSLEVDYIKVYQYDKL